MNEGSGNGNGATDGHAGTTTLSRRRRNPRRLSSNGRRPEPKRKTRRRFVSLEHFDLFSRDGKSMKPIKKDGWNPNAGTEEQKFYSSIDESMICIPQLQETWRDIPYMRCRGGRRRNQKFICVTTVRMKRVMFNGGNTVSVLFSLILEEDSKKIRTLNVRRERRMDGDGTIYEDKTNWICSCDIYSCDGSTGDSSCWHIVTLRRNYVMVDKIKSVVQVGFVEDHFVYYGDMLRLTEKDTNGTFKYDHVDGTITEEECAVIAIQLDDYSKEDLVVKSNRVAKRWSAWVTVDPMDRLLVSVVWRPVNSRISATRMICTMCRTEGSKKCQHEVACELESVVGTSHERESDVEGSNSEYEGDELDMNDGNEESGLQSDGTGVHVMAPAQDGEADDIVPTVAETSNMDDDDLPSNGSDVTYGMPAINRKDSKKFFPPKMNRTFMFCASEREKAAILSDLIEQHDAQRGTLLFADADGTPCRGVVRDRRGRRVRCPCTRVQDDNDKPRKATLFTVNQGAITILVIDWICASCQFVNRYQGNEHGLFPAAAGTVYSVELMYLWVSEMCGGTRAFRSVYKTTRSVQLMPSYARRYETSIMKKWEGCFEGNRRNANKAVRLFINLMDLDSKEVASQVFSRSKCEVTMNADDFEQLGLDPVEHDGMKRLHSVVVDAKIMSLLKESRPEDDKHDVVTGVTGLTTRIIKKRNNQNALKLMMKTVRHAISRHRNRRSVGAEARMDGGDMFEVVNGHLRLGLWDIGQHGSTKAQCARPKVLDYISICRWYV